MFNFDTTSEFNRKIYSQKKKLSRMEVDSIEIFLTTNI